jgi:hypothetical protein
MFGPWTGFRIKSVQRIAQIERFQIRDFKGPACNSHEGKKYLSANGAYPPSIVMQCSCVVMCRHYSSTRVHDCLGKNQGFNGDMNNDH